MGLRSDRISVLVRGDTRRCPSASQGGLTRNQNTWHLDLGLPTSRTVRNKLSVSEGALLWYFVNGGGAD